MFVYRINCSNKDRAFDKINKIIENDVPCGKSLFGTDLYKSGIHFQNRNEGIKGFYLDESENESSKGSPLRVEFSGSIKKENDGYILTVYIYPRIQEALFLIFAFVFLSISGKAIGAILSILLLLFFGKGYHDMISKAYNNLKIIFS